MLNVLGENYYIDLDKIESFLDMTTEEGVNPETGVQDIKINVIKFEIVKMLLEVVLSEELEVDEKLGMKTSNNISVPFKLAFNSLLNKKLINHY